MGSTRSRALFLEALPKRTEVVKVQLASCEVSMRFGNLESHESPPLKASRVLPRILVDRKGTEMDGSYMHDNRRYARFELLECAMLYVGEETEPVRVMIADIGLGGVQLRSKEAVPVDQPLVLHIGRDGSEPLAIKGRVLYSHPGEEPMYVTGFCFTPETHEERVAVAEYVHGVFQNQFDALAG